MSALEMLFIEIEKHAVLRGHANLVKDARAELAEKDAEIKRLKDKVNHLVDRVDELKRQAALNSMNSSNFYR